MNKRIRQGKILDIISTRNVETQEELCKLLNEHGFMATQATVSRDIRELDLYKVSVPGGGFKYDTSRGPVDNSKTARVLRDSVISIGEADKIVVIKTASGMAMAAAAAIDAMHLPQITGTIAGDDTIMCAIKCDGESEPQIQSLKALLLGE